MKIIAHISDLHFGHVNESAAAGLLYDLEKQGLSATVLYNRIGERIYLVGDLSSGAGSPDIYEAPRSLVDFNFQKRYSRTKVSCV